MQCEMIAYHRTDPCCCRSEDDRERGDLLCGAAGQRHRALPLLPLPLRPHRTPGGQFNRHLEFRVSFFDKFGDSFST